MCQNNFQTNQDGNVSFSSGITLDFLQNPAYFGTVDISPNVPTESEGALIGPEIKEKLRETIVNDFVVLQREIQRVSGALPGESESTSSEVATSFQTRVERMPILTDHPQNRVLFNWSGDNYSVYFEGDGNIDFECGNCRTLLARKVWKSSCNNIVLECPKCKYYNEFSSQDPSLFLKTTNIAIEANDLPYRCGSTIAMKRGLSLIGVEHDYHLLKRQ